MEIPRILARAAAVISSILLVTGFIAYRTGALQRFLVSDPVSNTDSAIAEREISKNRIDEDGNSDLQSTICVLMQARSKIESSNASTHFGPSSEASESPATPENHQEERPDDKTPVVMEGSKNGAIVSDFPWQSFYNWYFASTSPADLLEKRQEISYTGSLGGGDWEVGLNTISRPFVMPDDWEVGLLESQVKLFQSINAMHPTRNRTASSEDIDGFPLPTESNAFESLNEFDFDVFFETEFNGISQLSRQALHQLVRKKANDLVADSHRQMMAGSKSEIVVRTDDLRTGREMVAYLLGLLEREPRQ